LAFVPQAIAAAPAPSPSGQFVTEHSPSQNRVDRANATPVGYQIQTENSPSQNRVDRLNAPSVYTVSASGGFPWGDAGVGASAGVGAVLLALGSTLVLLRKRARVAH
jgi:hypothetical protein